MASVRVRFTGSSRFLSGAGYPGEHVFRVFLGEPAEMRAILEQPNLIFRGNGAPDSSSSLTMMEQIALREILLLGKIQG
jgi:hypothetical protein